MMFVFDPLSLNFISLISCLLYIVHIHMLDIICVCRHLCSTKRAYQSTLTLNLEESRGVAPEPFTGNWGSLLVTHSMFVIKF